MHLGVLGWPATKPSTPRPAGPACLTSSANLRPLVVRCSATGLRGPLSATAPAAAGMAISTTTWPPFDGDWAAAVCDNCYADLHPEIAVSVASSPRACLQAVSRRSSSASARAAIAVIPISARR